MFSRSQQIYDSQARGILKIHMMRFMILALGGFAVVPGGAMATPVIERVRGTIEATDAGSVTVRTIDGTIMSLALTPATKVIAVAKSSLSAIMDGSFVGTATKGDNPPRALEVHIFPESMRGTGEGHREWDVIQDTLAGDGRVKSAMTNGSVKAAAAAPPRVKSAMTNGTVARSTGTGGDQMLTLAYNNGQSKTIAVSPQTPIVSYEPTDQSALRDGAKVFGIIEHDGDRLTAVRVMIGKDGITPPM